MISYRTQGFNGYAVQYSPFFDSKIAVASAANFGLVGNGRLYILNLSDQGTIVAESAFDTQDGLFDLAWSEIHENHVVTANGDGDLKLFDIKAVGQVGGQGKFPIQVFHEHQREVFSVNWNLAEKSLFCSSSWDGTIKVWTPNRSHSILTLHAPPTPSSSIPAATATATASHPPHPQHPSAPLNNHHQSPPLSHTKNHEPTSPACIHAAKFSPHSPHLLASAHADSHIRIWDTRSNSPLTQDFFAHAATEALALDWNKYRPTVLASAGVDKAVKIWDLRMVPESSATTATGHHPTPTSYPSPANELLGHDYAVRSVAWSPHAADILLSTSYDMTARVWRDVSANPSSQGPGGSYMGRLNHNSGLLNVMNAHSEFVVGCDWSLWGQPGWVATVGWDEMLHVWKAV